MRSDLKGATSSLLELQSYSIEHEPANDTATDAASYISTTISDALSLQTFANCSSKPHVGGSCSDCAGAFINAGVSVGPVVIESSICTSCNLQGEILTDANLNTLDPPPTCWRGVPLQLRPYCLGSELYSLLLDEGQPSNLTGATLFLLLFLAASLLVLLFGQAIGTPALLLITMTTALLFAFVILHTLLPSTCALPIVLALLAATIITVAAAIFVKRLNDRRKSRVLLLTSSIAGGYGVALAARSLARLHSGTEQHVPSIVTFLVFLFAALSGLLVQLLFTGDEAASNRDEARRRLLRERSRLDDGGEIKYRDDLPPLVVP